MGRLAQIGDIQVADLPGRCQPVTEEINCAGIARALIRMATIARRTWRLGRRMAPRPRSKRFARCSYGIHDHMAKLAVITGGNTGIGRVISVAFARAGYAVAFSWRAKSEMATSLVDEVESLGARALAIECDVGIESEVIAFFDKVVDWFGEAPDVLVNNAGVQTWASLLELSVVDWEAVIRTNLTGTFLNTREAARRMVADHKEGAIINIGSGCNKLAFPKLVDYTASKGGIEQFTKVAAVELGPSGIRVNCVAPGAIINDRTAAESPDYVEIWSRITPLGRAGTAEDIVGPVLFLAGESSGFVTGQTLWVDGGVFTQASWPQGA